MCENGQIGGISIDPLLPKAFADSFRCCFLLIAVPLYNKPSAGYSPLAIDKVNHFLWLHWSRINAHIAHAGTSCIGIYGPVGMDGNFPKSAWSPSMFEFAEPPPPPVPSDRPSRICLSELPGAIRLKWKTKLIKCGTWNQILIKKSDAGSLHF